MARFKYNQDAMPDLYTVSKQMLDILSRARQANDGQIHTVRVDHDKLERIEERAEEALEAVRGGGWTKKKK